MAYLIGTDEAGYGPNLGPLVIGASLWRVPDGVTGERLYDCLPSIESTAAAAAQAKPERLLIADSKALYRSGGGLAELERSVLAALAATGDQDQTDGPGSWRQLLSCCDPASLADADAIAWYAGYDRALPVDADPAQMEQARRLLRDALAAGSVELLALRARVVFPDRFNRRVGECDNKATALSLWTLELIAQLLSRVDGGEILIQSDKHGGRKRYAALLQHVFQDAFIEVVQETRRQSVYRWTSAQRRVEMRVLAGGESCLPAALASMLAKYLRELAMEALNGFWRRHVPQLRPTAGYPVDARRFRRAIEPQRQRLGIPEAMLWRDR